MKCCEWRHDTQHNDIQHNGTQHNDNQHNNKLNFDTQHNNIQHNGQSIVILTVTYAECHIKAPYAECCDTEYRYAECHYAECRGAAVNMALVANSKDFIFFVTYVWAQ